MDAKILRFPGFILTPDRKHVLHQGKVYKHTPDMCRDLSQQERWQTLNWYKATQKPKGADYRKMYLSMTDEQLGCGGSAA
jgi:hypothetical protein